MVISLTFPSDSIIPVNIMGEFRKFLRLEIRFLRLDTEIGEMLGFLENLFIFAAHKANAGLLTEGQSFANFVERRNLR